jgi:hypothetical protein
MTAAPAQRTQDVDRLKVLQADVQVLLATAHRIREGLANAHRASRNPITQQTNAEWLRAYDAADLAPRLGAS